MLCGRQGLCAEPAMVFHFSLSFFLILLIMLASIPVRAHARPDPLDISYLLLGPNRPPPSLRAPLTALAPPKALLFRLLLVRLFRTCYSSKRRGGMGRVLRKLHLIPCARSGARAGRGWCVGVDRAGDRGGAGVGRGCPMLNHF